MKAACQQKGGVLPAPFLCAILYPMTIETLLQQIIESLNNLRATIECIHDAMDSGCTPINDNAQEEE